MEQNIEFDGTTEQNRNYALTRFSIITRLTISLINRVFEAQKKFVTMMCM